MFDWDDLKIFHALIETGSMSAAARKLGIGQPTVSRRLDQLESRIGARLVTRGAEGVELTDIGDRIWAQVQIMQSTASKVEHLAHQADRSDSGTVRLAAPDGVAAYWIARSLSSFMEANPDINVELSTRTDGDTLNEQADIILQMTESKRMNHVAEELATLHYVPFAAQHYLDIYGPPQGLADVINHRVGDLVNYRQQQEHWPKEAAALKQMMQPSLTTDDSASLFEAVKTGSVIAMLPTYVSKLDPELVHLDMEMNVPITLWMVYHPDLRRVTRVKKLLDWLNELFDSTQYPWFRKDFIQPTKFGDTQTIHIRGERPRPKSI